MLTIDDLKSLKLGDKFNLGKVFPALTDKMLKWELVEVDHRGNYSFVLSYFGVFFGSYTVTVKDGVLTAKEG